LRTKIALGSDPLDSSAILTALLALLPATEYDSKLSDQEIREGMVRFRAIIAATLKAQKNVRSVSNPARTAQRATDVGRVAPDQSSTQALAPAADLPDDIRM
jgi:hypothetical protein